MVLDLSATGPLTLARISTRRGNEQRKTGSCPPTPETPLLAPRLALEEMVEMVRMQLPTLAFAYVTIGVGHEL